MNTFALYCLSSLMLALMSSRARWVDPKGLRLWRSAARERERVAVRVEKGWEAGRRGRVERDGRQRGKEEREVRLGSRAYDDEIGTHDTIDG